MARKQLKGKPKTTTDWQSYAPWILVALCFISYFPALTAGLTQLDDTIFINDKHFFISKFSNIGTAFTQGCFNEKDIYYRPVLLVYFILLYPFSSPDSVAVFHFGSLVLHILNVILLHRLLRRLINQRTAAFWLTAFFAIHPALTMAVAWIPGINDLLLTAFALGYCLTLLDLAQTGSRKSVLLNTLFLLLALFTKESGAFLPAGGFLLLLYKGLLKNSVKKFTAVIPLHLVAWLCWFFARKNVLPADAPALINSEMLTLVFYRLEGLVQYFGKCLLPFNLNVFPTIESTATVWGITALLLAAALVAMNKERNLFKAAVGFCWFTLFLLPIFFVPKNINDQLFEHRLYLPMAGVLLILNETVLFSSALKRRVGQGIVLVCGITWITLIRVYIPAFNDTFSFWYRAVEASPQNAYANKLLGIKLAESKKSAEAIPFIRKAYELDSNERYTRLFLARLIFIPNQKWDSARYYLEREKAVNPRFGDTYAELAHVCVEQKDLACAELNILKFLEFKPMDPMLNSNLILLYKDQGKYRKAKEHADKMRSMGLEVNEAIYRLISDSANVTR